MSDKRLVREILKEEQETRADSEYGKPLILSVGPAVKQYQQGIIQGLVSAMVSISGEIEKRFPEEDFLPVRLNSVMIHPDLIKDVSKRFEKYGYKLVKVEDE